MTTSTSTITPLDSQVIREIEKTVGAVMNSIGMNGDFHIKFIKGRFDFERHSSSTSVAVSDCEVDCCIPGTASTEKRVDGTIVLTKQAGGPWYSLDTERTKLHVD